jgi:nitrilase
MDDSTSPINTILNTPSSLNSASKVVRVAATQLESIDFDLDANVAKACKYIALAAEQGCQLIGFSECFVPGYPYFIW